MKKSLNKAQKKKVILVILYIFFITISFVLPIFSFEGYSIIRNTTSHLGAQGSPNAWIMNLLFITLGLTSLRIVLSSKVYFHQMIGSFFGVSLLLTGLFRHGSLIDPSTSNLLLDQMHSIFATTTGISFVFLSFGHAFMTKARQKIAGFLLGIISTLISFGMMIFPDYMGLLQRLMFILAFGWLFFYMKTPLDKTKYNKNINI